MKAILVEFSLLTRIVVPDDFDIDNLTDKEYTELREKAVPKFHDKLNEDGIGDMLALIEDDTQMPYDENIELSGKELEVLQKRSKNPGI